MNFVRYNDRSGSIHITSHARDNFIWTIHGAGDTRGLLDREWSDAIFIEVSRFHVDSSNNLNQENAALTLCYPVPSTRRQKRYDYG